MKPRQGDDGGDQGTRERILLAARRLFSEKGFRSTSIRDIIEAAGVNVDAVNYHFGGKKNLYLEVLGARTAVYRAARREALAKAMAGEADLEAALRAFVTSCLSGPSTVAEAEEDIALFFREMSTPGPGFDIILREMIEPTQAVMTGILLREVPTMTPERARLCLASIMAQVAHFARTRKVFSRIFGRPYDEAAAAAVADHIVRFSLRGILGKEETE